MRVNKSQALLYIFEMLINNNAITKTNIMSELDINELTFKRYMQEIRAFIYNFNKEYELIYSRSMQKYFFKKN